MRPDPTHGPIRPGFTIRCWLILAGRADGVPAGEGGRESLRGRAGGRRRRRRQPRDYNRDRVRSLTSAGGRWWMLEVATARAHEELGSIPLKVVQADCSAMASIEDCSFDTVLDTYGVCSFEDPVRALSEMARVCRPDGRVLLLEHGMASLGPLRALQAFFAEPWAWRHGCRCDFDILALVEASGRLEVARVERRTLGMTYVLVCKPRPGAAAPAATEVEDGEEETVRGPGGAGGAAADPPAAAGSSGPPATAEELGPRWHLGGRRRWAWQHDGGAANGWIEFGTGGALWTSFDKGRGDESWELRSDGQIVATFGRCHHVLALVPSTPDSAAPTFQLRERLMRDGSAVRNRGAGLRTRGLLLEPEPRAGGALPASEEA
ncbi:unnamed protein product [Prorocentrum cordatum]|uniref:Methyltransferase type 11 domain-containing protein n=1 Tax=Prorocentrum cordatum TaxID=2364126 RepID=A0ABN9VQ97_9DINO|nr:unnamed protein product [Polarella glacialis]